MVKCPIIRPSPRTATAASAKAISCGDCLKQCCGAALARGCGGDGFAVDASLIKADANRQNGIEGEKGPGF